NEELVRHFISSVGIYPVDTLVRLESGLLGIVVEQNGADLLRPRVRVAYDTLKNWELAPYDLDLATSADRIVSHEPPERWKIDTRRYLESAV
ncbi:MAG: phosphodiesterase, partial [Sulfuricella sp.]